MPRPANKNIGIAISHNAHALECPTPYHRTTGVPATKNTDAKRTTIRFHDAYDVRSPQKQTRLTAGQYAQELRWFMVMSNDPVERPATMTVPRPDAAHHASRPARTRC